MRIGTNGTRWWISMGPLGWIIVAVIRLAALIIAGVIWLLVQIVRAFAWGIGQGWREIRAIRARRRVQDCTPADPDQEAGS